MGNLHLDGVVNQPVPLISISPIFTGCGWDCDRDHVPIVNVIEIDKGGVDQMVHPLTLVIKQPPGMECESLCDLIDIVMDSPVLNVPVVIDHLPCESLEGVRLQGVPLNEQGIPSTKGIDIVQDIFCTLCDNLVSLSSDDHPVTVSISASTSAPIVVSPDHKRAISVGNRDHKILF